MSAAPPSPVPQRQKSSAAKYIFILVIALALGATILVLREDQGDWTPPPEARQRKNPVPANQSTVAGGEAMYKVRCANCHGENGDGKGPEANRYSPAPADLTDPLVRNTTDGELFWKITAGRRPMPSFRTKLTDEERWEVVLYLRTLTQNSNSNSVR